MALAIAHTVEELGDCVGLIAAWLVIAGKLEIHGVAALSSSNLLCAAQFFIITHADKLDFAPITLIRHDQVEGYQGLSRTSGIVIRGSRKPFVLDGSLPLNMAISSQSESFGQQTQSL